MWTFWVLVVVALAYLAVVTWFIVSDARASLGYTRTHVPGIDNLLTVTGSVSIPPDGMLRPSHVEFCLRIAEMANEMNAAGMSEHSRITKFAHLLNSYALSRATYVWARTRLQRAIVNPTTHTDSVNARLIHIMHPRMELVKQVYHNHLDTLLLGTIK